MVFPENSLSRPPSSHFGLVLFGIVQYSFGSAFDFLSCGVTNADRITSIIYDTNAKMVCEQPKYS